MTNQDEADRRRQDLIEKRAYEIYQDRGGVDDLDLQDWLQAEAEIDGLPPDDDRLQVSEEEQPSS